MLCENCNKNQASVHTVEVYNGVKQERYLCAQCADNEGFSPVMMGILSGLGHVRVKEKVLACECGATLTDFERTGLLGCPKCYKTFMPALLPVIRRAQGGRELHVGRRPVTARDERTELEAELKAAVEQERYERAAELRDMLRAMEG